MIDTIEFITDAQLIGAFDAGPVKSGVAEGKMPAHQMAGSLRLVAEMSIAAYINTTLPGKLEQLDRVTAAVEQITGETLA